MKETKNAPHFLKHFLLTIFCLIIIVSLYGYISLSLKMDSSDDVTINKPNDEDYNQDLLKEIYLEEQGNPIALYKEELLYTMNFKNFTETQFYTLNMKTNKRNYIGKIKYPYSTINSITSVDDILYMYVTPLDNNEAVNLVLYRIDLKNKKIDDIHSGKSVDGNSFIVAFDDKIYSTKRSIESGEDISYIDVMDISGILSNKKFVVYHLKDRKILNLTKYDNNFYILKSNNEGEDYEITIHTHEGELIKTIKATDALKDLTQFMISNFVVCGDYVFIGNFQGGKICKIVDNELLPIVICDETLIISTHENGGSNGQIIVFTREDNKLWVLNSQNDILYQIELEEYKLIKTLGFVVNNDLNDVLITCSIDDVHYKDTEYLYFYSNISVLEKTDIADFSKNLEVINLSSLK